MQIVNDMAALAKTILKSRRPSPAGRPRQDSIIVMGNGPSLRQAIDNHSGWLHDNTLMAVNFAANAAEFFSLRPQYYILADPHFFQGFDRDANVGRLWDNISKSDWEMTLLVPVRERGMVAGLKGRGVDLPAGIKVKYYNLTPADGSSGLLHKLFDLGLAMPRPRNVLIPAIMTAIREGFRKIYLAGADHSWTKTLWVDDDNHVMSVQPHFYKDSKKELERVRSDYEGLKISDVLGSMTIAFRSYHDIRSYAERRGVEILNATPGSFIDAFPRYMPGN